MIKLSSYKRKWISTCEDYESICPDPYDAVPYLTEIVKGRENTFKFTLNSLFENATLDGLMDNILSNVDVKIEQHVYIDRIRTNQVLLTTENVIKRRKYQFAEFYDTMQALFHNRGETISVVGALRAS